MLLHSDGKMKLKNLHEGLTIEDMFLIFMLLQFSTLKKLFSVFAKMEWVSLSTSSAGNYHNVLRK
jgi:hypothetical protein